MNEQELAEKFRDLIEENKCYLSLGQTIGALEIAKYSLLTDLLLSAGYVKKDGGSHEH